MGGGKTGSIFSTMVTIHCNGSSLISRKHHRKCRFLSRRVQMKHDRFQSHKVFQLQICSSQNVGLLKTCDFGDGDDDSLMRFSPLREDELKEMLGRIPLDMRRELDRWIRIVVNAEQQKNLSLIKENFGLDILTSMTRNFDYTASILGSQALQLQFLNGISTPVSTGMDIKGEDHKPFIVALVDGTGKIVNTGAGSAATVEIVVLEGDCNDDEAEDWSSDEFNSKIISDWNGTKVLQGNIFVKLKEGIGCVDKISFTHNKTWKKKRDCRLGARPLNAVFAKEAKTESFLVRDKRKRSYEKHDIPYLHDDVWRLNKIDRKGTLMKSLTQANIKTVGDFIDRLFLNRQCLKEIFDREKHAKSLEITVKHALTCPAKLKYCSNYEQKHEVIFNVSGEALGLYLHGQFLSRNILSETQKEDAKKLVVSAFENWGDVKSVDEDQFVADCSNPVVHGFTKTEIVTLCINTLATTYDKSIYLNGLDLVINETSLFGNMLSDEQHPNPQFLPESLRQQYNEIYGGLESVCTSNEHESEHVLRLVGTKTAKNKRFCRRWRMLACVVTFTRFLPKRSLDNIHAHKKPRLS